MAPPHPLHMAQIALSVTLNLIMTLNPLHPPHLAEIVDLARPMIKGYSFGYGYGYGYGYG